MVATATIRASGGGFVQFEITAEQAAIIDALATGDRFILAGTRPTPTTVDHAVDSGDAAHAWAAPQPTVTLTAAVSGVSVFDASIVPGWTDVANATPGVVWATANSGDHGQGFVVSASFAACELCSASRPTIGTVET